MIRECKGCGRKFKATGKKLYHSPKCKKDYENSLRSYPDNRGESGTLWDPSDTICRPRGLNGTAAEFWDKVAPTVISRGHLNVLSEDAFAELCDLYSRLKDINKAIDGSITQTDDSKPVSDTASLCENKPGSDAKESVLSDLKRKYSKQFLDYCREFYLTPRVNRGNFGLTRDDGKQDKKDDMFD
jgi:phage terminase small subunit